VAAEDVERSAAQQERAGVAVELDDELADGRVAERGRPAAMGEGVAAIFIRSAGRLHHAVEGQERLHGEVHVRAKLAVSAAPQRDDPIDELGAENQVEPGEVGDVRTALTPRHGFPGRPARRR
jgi:hypothetical protein